MRTGKMDTLQTESMTYQHTHRTHRSHGSIKVCFVVIGPLGKRDGFSSNRLVKKIQSLNLDSRFEQGIITQATKQIFTHKRTFCRLVGLSWVLSMIFIATWNKKNHRRIKEYLKLTPNTCVEFVSRGQARSIMLRRTNDSIILIIEHQLIGTP